MVSSEPQESGKVPNRVRISSICDACLPKIEPVGIPKAKEETSYLIEKVLLIDRSGISENARGWAVWASSVASRSACRARAAEMGVEFDEKSVVYWVSVWSFSQMGLSLGLSGGLREAGVGKGFFANGRLKLMNLHMLDVCMHRVGKGFFANGRLKHDKYIVCTDCTYT